VDLFRIIRPADPATGTRQHFVQPISVAVDGNNVTVDLGKGVSTTVPSSDVLQLHNTDVTAIRSTAAGGLALSAGSDGAILEVLPSRTKQFPVVLRQLDSLKNLKAHNLRTSRYSRRNAACAAVKSNARHLQSDVSGKSKGFKNSR